MGEGREEWLPLCASPSAHFPAFGGRQDFLFHKTSNFQKWHLACWHGGLQGRHLLHGEREHACLPWHETFENGMHAPHGWNLHFWELAAGMHISCAQPVCISLNKKHACETDMCLACGLTPQLLHTGKTCMRKPAFSLSPSLLGDRTETEACALFDSPPTSCLCAVAASSLYL